MRIHVASPRSRAELKGSLAGCLQPRLTRRERTSIRHWARQVGSLAMQDCEQRLMRICEAAVLAGADPLDALHASVFSEVDALLRRLGASAAPAVQLRDPING